MKGDPQVPVAFTRISVDTSRDPNSPSKLTTNPSSPCSTFVTVAGRTTFRSKCSS